MGSPGIADPVKYPFSPGSLHVPCGFQCQASMVSSVFWRYVTGCQPEARGFCRNAIDSGAERFVWAKAIRGVFRSDIDVDGLGGGENAEKKCEK